MNMKNSINKIINIALANYLHNRLAHGGCDYGYLRYICRVSKTAVYYCKEFVIVFALPILSGILLNRI